MDRSLVVIPVAGARLRAVLTSRYLREPLIWAFAYAFYYLARHAADDARPAFDNARDLMRFEESLGIFKELSLQSAAISYDLLVHIFNVIYFYGHWPAIIGFGVYLFIAKPHIYTLTRNAFLISGAVALVFFALFPVAPPRLSMAGIVDTLSMTVPLDYDDSPLVNPYAALPSMHVGWCLVLGIGLYLSTKVRIVRFFAVLLTPAMLLATVITGNHFFIDGIFGTLLAGAAFLLALWLQRRGPSMAAAARARFRQLSPGNVN
ncbi:MAG TPA: phosphatase PAP2 family protein [Dehalococcoidia bacterium]|nr:phosphatase PAP2 family protein [Dehalococcoidia bacterium]